MAWRIRSLIGSDADVGQEISDLLEILSGNGARSQADR
jgi:hypothetical protein